MKNLLLFFLIFLCHTMAAQITFENAFPNLTFNLPVDIQSNGVAGDNRLYVVEQPGVIRVFQNQSNTNFSNTFLDIRNKVNFNFGQEMGLLGLAFHPNYNQNGYFYVSYTNNVNGTIGIVIERYRVNPNNPNRADANSGCVVLSFLKNQGNTNHNGGSLAFGPDGLLYIAVGDGGGGGDPMGNAQNLNSLFGKILRINVNASCPGYAIPSGNPLITSSGANEIYAWGLRNPWRISFDGQTLWAGDVGQGQFEEINIIRNGRNYGWNRFEANSIFNFSTPNFPNHATPIFSYNHTQGDRSITGGYVYRGNQIGGDLSGQYVFGDFVSGRVWSLDYNAQTGATNRNLLFDTNFQISTFGRDNSNELYFAAFGNTGQIYKITGNNTSPDACSIARSGCTLTVNGLTGNDFIKIFDAGFNVVLECSPFGNNPCNATEVFTGSENGTYYVQGCQGNFDAFVLNGCSTPDPCAGQGGDSDGDGICNNQDCQPNNAAFPGTPGSPCNDGNPNTSNDVITGNGCGCSGTSSSGGGCAVSVGNCSLTLTGLTGSDFIKVFDGGFNVVWQCSPYGSTNDFCSSTEVVSNLAIGTYYVQNCQGDFDAYEVSGCSGTQPMDGCVVSNDNCSLTLNGLTSNDFIKIFDEDFNVVWQCSPYGSSNDICSSREVVAGLSSGTYFLQGCEGDFDRYEVNCSQGAGAGRGAPGNSADAELEDYSSAVSLYPNPVRDELNIDLAAFSGAPALIRIFNIQGVLVKEISLPEVPERPAKIDLQEINSGLYILTLKIADRKLISKSFSVMKLY